MRMSRFMGLGVGAVLAALGMASLGPAITPEKMGFLAPSMPTIAKPPRRRRKSTKHPTNGKREVERRLRQIAAGQLTRSNGLVTREELYGAGA